MFGSSLRAVLFDVDGTLYHQKPLQGLMAFELCSLPATLKSWRLAISTVQTLRCFRSAREDLRRIGNPEDYLLLELQYRKASERAGVEPTDVERVVSEWIYRRPLKYLPYCRRRGIEAFLSDVGRKGLRIGVFSDYPVRAKLQALGLTNQVDLMLCSTDKEVNAFKPHPRGFLHACKYWELRPEEVLYVGDRPEVDAKGAVAAGMPCAILAELGSGWGSLHSSDQYVMVPSFRKLQQILATGC